jgi:DNA-binding NarL/FixJ family response regulator
MFHVIAHVELILDARAHRQPVDEDDALGRVRVALAQAHLALPGHELGIEQADSDAHLAHAAATLTRLGAPEPDAWAEAAQRWEHLGDPFWVANARLHEAGAAAACGAASRAAGALQHAHQLALALGASTLLADIEATSRRTRLGLAAPAPAVLDEAATIGLGLTPREAEVLGLVAAGQTNRQIGERLYVSEKTASVHVSNILRKLGVRTRVDAAAVAQRVGIA